MTKMAEMAEMAEIRKNENGNKEDHDVELHAWTQRRGVRHHWYVERYVPN